jgi:hypothetical protein
MLYAPGMTSRREYGPEDIQMLGPVEAVRRRPDVFFGPERRAEQLAARLLLEPVVSKGTHWTFVEARWDEPGVITLVDDDLSLQDPQQLRNLCLTTMAYGRGPAPRARELCAEVALCAWFIIELQRPEGLHRQRFEAGIVQPAEELPAVSPWLTRVRFKPDTQFFPTASPLSAEVVRREVERQLDEYAQEDWGARRPERWVPGVSFRVLPDGLVLTPTGTP